MILYISNKISDDFVLTLNITNIIYISFRETTLQIVSQDFTQSLDLLTEEFVYNALKITKLIFHIDFDKVIRDVQTLK